MTISKKDTVVLAVLFNIVVLAGILATAHQLSSKACISKIETKSQPPSELIGEENVQGPVASIEEGAIAFDEIDQLLENYISDDLRESVAVASDKDSTQGIKANEGTATEGYYIVKAGDNPWKIAKKFHLSFEKLLQLNQLDEARARNLKIGQKLKIKEIP